MSSCPLQEGMKKIIALITIIFAATAFKPSSPVKYSPAAIGELKAGAAAVDLDMPEGTPIAGYGGGARRNLDPLEDCSEYSHYFKPFEGIISPVRAKALVLQKGNAKIAWVGIDLVASSTEFVDYVTAKLSTMGYSKENVFISASHTHSGPGAFSSNRFWSIVAVDRFNQEIFEHISDKIVQAIQMADSQLAPAKIGIDQLKIDDVTSNRRGNSFLDPVATIIRVDSLNNQPIATAFNFPIHGTILGMGNLSLSSDVPGAIEHEIEKRTGAVALFLNGAEGDVSPHAGNESSAPERVEALGIKIGTAISDRWAAMTTKTDVKNFGYVSYQLTLPSAKLNLLACIEKGASGWQIDMGHFMPDSAPFHGFVLDDTAFVTIPGEAITELGVKMKDFGKNLGFSKVAVVGLTNEHLGYILTTAEYNKGGMESCGSLYGENLGTFILDSADKVLTDLALQSSL